MLTLDDLLQFPWAGALIRRLPLRTADRRLNPVATKEPSAEGRGGKQALRRQAVHNLIHMGHCATMDAVGWMMAAIRWLIPFWTLCMTITVKGPASRRASFVLGIIATLLNIYYFFMCRVPVVDPILFQELRLGIVPVPAIDPDHCGDDVGIGLRTPGGSEE